MPEPRPSTSTMMSNAAAADEFAAPPPSSPAPNAFAPPPAGDSFMPSLTTTQRKPAWVEDSSAECCFHCQRTFTMFLRRHHCRLCGQVFCDSCTADRKLLPVFFGIAEPQRVCPPCAHELEPQQHTLKQTISNSQRSNALKPGAYMGGYRRYLNNPVKWDLAAEIRKAAWIVRNQTEGFETNLPGDVTMQESLFHDAVGLAILTTMQCGAMASMRFGTGIVVRRVDNHWSAPCAVKTFAVGFGACLGLETTDHILVMSDEQALDTFTSDVSAATGTDATLAFGPFGRSAHADMRVNSKAMSSAMSYSHSRGFYGGVSIELSGLSVRADVNRNFYGTHVSAAELLEPGGGYEPPPAAQPLYDALDDLFALLTRRRLAAADEAQAQQAPYRPTGTYTAGATAAYGASDAGRSAAASDAAVTM